MKKLLALIIGMAFAATLASAHPPEDGEHKRGKGGDPEKRMAHMQKELGLSDAQVTQMREIKAKGGSREEMQTVMTEEQRAQAKVLREQHREMKRQRKQQHAPKGVDSAAGAN